MFYECTYTRFKNRKQQQQLSPEKGWVEGRGQYCADENILVEWMKYKTKLHREGKRNRRWHLARLHLSPPQLWEYFLCWENTPEVSLLHSSSICIQFAGQGSSSRCPSGNKASNINSQTPTYNQSFAQVLPLQRKKWNGRCPQRCETKPTWKCFHSLDAKPFIFGSLAYL